MAENKTIRSVNWHITMNCNYKCRFCFYKNMKGEFNDIDKAESMLKTLRSRGIEKINFAGGEPLLYKNLNYLLEMAKHMRFTVSIVTNASLLNKKNIQELAAYVDWVGISVDSADERIEKELGRGYGKHVEHARVVSKLVHEHDMKLKINTTVMKLNYSEDMRKFIASVSPERWKVFQFIHMKGQNDDAIDLAITKEKFEKFKEINGNLMLKNGTSPVFEANSDMLDSYLIIGTDGNIIMSRNNERSVLPFASINTLDLSDIVDIDKYCERKAVYDWNGN